MFWREKEREITMPNATSLDEIQICRNYAKEFRERFPNSILDVSDFITEKIIRVGTKNGNHLLDITINSGEDAEFFQNFLSAVTILRSVRFDCGVRIAATEKNKLAISGENRVCFNGELQVYNVPISGCICKTGPFRFQNTGQFAVRNCVFEGQRGQIVLCDRTTLRDNHFKNVAEILISGAVKIVGSNTFTGKTVIKPYQDNNQSGQLWNVIIEVRLNQRDYVRIVLGDRNPVPIKFVPEIRISSRGFLEPTSYNKLMDLSKQYPNSFSITSITTQELRFGIQSAPDDGQSVVMPFAVDRIPPPLRPKIRKEDNRWWMQLLNSIKNLTK